MNRSSWLAIGIPLVTLLVGSDAIRAELLTNFKIESIQSDSRLELSIENIGHAQADNAAVLIHANGTIGDFTDACAEGDMERLDDDTLVAKFSRMSPQMPCRFDLVASNGVDLDVKISSDGRLTPWTEASHYIRVFTGIVMLPIIAEGLAVFFAFRKPIAHLWAELAFRLLKKSFKESRNTKKIIQFVKTEYGAAVTVADATILELIFCGRKTMGQLVKHSGLAKRYVEHCITRLRRRELLSKDGLKLDDALRRHFEKLG